MEASSTIDWSRPPPPLPLLSMPLLERPCIDVGHEIMTVAAYDAVLQEKKTIWTWHATPVAQLTPEPADSYQRVFDVEAYEAQMLRMLGLD